MDVMDAAVTVLDAIRKAKAGKSLRWPVDRVTITGTPEFIEAVRLAEGDLRNAGNVAEFVYVEG